MLFIIKTICLCLALWGICYLGTGTDKKNLQGLSSYPDVIQNHVKSNLALASQVKTVSPTKAFFLNLLLYTILFLVMCFFEQKESFLENFWNVLIMGEILNLFDFLVIDMLWWRHTKRVRFTGTENQAELYRDPKNHLISFIKGMLMFFIAALVDGLILSYC